MDFYTECLVQLAALCLFDPSNVYLAGQGSYQVSGNFQYWDDAGRPYSGIRGRLALGVEAPVSRTLSFEYGIEHLSDPETTSDRGEERAFVGFVWRPFR